MLKKYKDPDHGVQLQLAGLPDWWGNTISFDWKETSLMEYLLILEGPDPEVVIILPRSMVCWPGLLILQYAVAGAVQFCYLQVTILTINLLPNIATSGGITTISTTPGTPSSASSTTTGRIRTGSATLEVPATGMTPTCWSSATTASPWTRSVLLSSLNTSRWFLPQGHYITARDPFNSRCKVEMWLGLFNWWSTREFFTLTWNFKELVPMNVRRSWIEKKVIHEEYSQLVEALV